MKITAIPVFRDNYVWALHDEQNAILIDPGEAAPILAWLEAGQRHPVAILVTHHHADHVGGIREITARHAIPVYGPAREAIPGRTHPLQGGESLQIAELDATFQVLATPGHTLGHLCYLGHGNLFCGDTLFSCGCGRLFEGTPAQMYDALGRIKALPPETRIYCAHEYTLENLEFALRVEPDNAAIRQRLTEALALRERNSPTLPVKLGTELATNPFLRCEVPRVVVAATQHTGHPLQPGLAAFTAVRAWRDEF
jgi:hydroxyacylglutathione hydrolase